MDTVPTNFSPSRLDRFKKYIPLTIIGGVFLIWIIFILFVGSITKFNNARHVEITRGDSLKTISEKLKNAGVIDSSSLLNTTILLGGNDGHIVSGTYSFERKEGIFFVAKRIVEGKTNIKSIKITFPEGFSSVQISKRLYELLPNFDSENFLVQAKEKEGFLFPDTYFLLPNATSSEIIARLQETFWNKTSKEFGWIRENESEIYKTLILASIIEEEVKEPEDKKKVADIFLRRMKIGMALQADSTLAYATGRDSLSLTVDDLKSDSPYNSYTHRGLPPTPISNPGLESIDAVLHPEPNKYVYFLTDKEGKVYYAKTFEEHKLNKQKYLK